MDNKRKALYQGSVINISSFMAQFTIAMVNLALVYRMRNHFHLSAQMVGVSASIYAVTYLVACLVLSPLTHRLKPPQSVTISMLLMVGAIGVILLTNQIGVAFAALVVYGGAMAFLWPQIEVWLARGKEGQELNRATSNFNVSWSLGLALSPLLTGALVETGTTLPLILAMALFLGVAILIGVARRTVFDEDSSVSEHTRIQNYEGVDQSTPLRFISWAGVLTVYTALGITLTIFPLYAQDQNLFSEAVVGSLLSVRGLVTMVMFVVLGRSKRWHFKRWLIILVQVAVALLLAGGIFAKTYLHYLFFFSIYGLLFAFAYSMSIFHGASGSLHLSQRMMIHEVLLTLGNIIGAIFGGGIYQKYGFSRVLLIASIGVVIPPLVALLFGNKNFVKQGV